MSHSILKKVAYTSLAATALFCLPISHAVGIDIASNTPYDDGWDNGDNGGSGFQAWAISASPGTGSAGTFIGDSTSGAGDINTGGESFGLFGNPAGSSVNADRAFSTSLVSGDVFSFQLALNFDNGNKGFDIFGGIQGKVFNFNVGSGGGVSADNGATLTPGTGAGYDYGGSDAVIDVSLTMTSTTAFAYNISRSSSAGFQGTLFSGTVTNLTDVVSGFRLYVNGTESGDSNNLYANNFQIVPEPSSFLLLIIGFALTLKRRRTVQ